ncbi:MAG: 4Fe-4S dicluster domain-containing protein [Candidatus Hodarchaeota archaeon]
MDFVGLSKLKGKELLAKVSEILGEHDPQSCYDCMKCTSGCPVTKINPEFAPHKIVVLTRMGFADELLKKQEIWLCAQCKTCKERCPQSVDPADLIVALRNIAYTAKIDIPNGYKLIVQKIYRKGVIREPTEVMSRDLDFFDREALGLPIIKLENLEKFQKEMKNAKLVESKRD